ncbi:hypothetical protein JOB18_048158 [Solea senegalensis]|uniref:Uncharacterized protein n=1 Tax=Solea senegalensis TaxID=28829 RepID=A0AAV6SBW2_SOLSE|nr:hypothetical protein JOB18_048158 [Solea senegalensis]
MSTSMSAGWSVRLKPLCGARSNVKAASWTPWLVGLTAVVVFLFIVFTILIVRRLLKKKRPAVSWDYNRTSELDSHSQTKQTSM